MIPEKCRYEVLSTNVQVRLAKAKIISLGPLLNMAKAKLFCLNSMSHQVTFMLPQRVFLSQKVVSHRPVYPSSKPRKDWDKLDAEVKKQSADEDMRRAMNKSFAESNGTVLSTNWKEVGTKKVESTPPDGIELKKWEFS
ncbi:hypothetical protein F2Q70_00017220 [Brassica cretica]|uniref:SGS domain-containing protein n=1 Tax=Brassica cretica TaxID=69181 RepID=A0A8S9HYP0_BRACR|nr:hypothetical protein F2Q70_00017220 [Brassica cretica]KAF2595650.1 hypothetical protein F2Q68_00010165 [Brassica cretica]